MSSDTSTTIKMEYDVETESDSSNLNLNVGETDSEVGSSNENSKVFSTSDLCSEGSMRENFGCASDISDTLLPQNISTKRKHNTLSLETKIEIIQRLENGESAASLAQIYDIGRATIFDIKYKKEKILEFASNFKNESILKDRKTLRRSKRILNTTTETEKVDKEILNCNILEEKPDPDHEVKGEVIAENISFGNNSSVKRKHNVLSLESKLEIIQRLEKGESIASLAPIYNVGRATVFDIKNKKDSILAFASQMKSEDDLKTRKTMRKANDAALEEALYLWYIQRLSQGHTVTGPLLCDKALELNNMFGGPSDFKASSGWLKNFRSRHGIKPIPNERQSSSVDEKQPADNSFLEAYLNLLQQEGYSRDDIYTVDKMEINLNSMPQKSFIFQHESENTWKSLESVTILLTANSNWNHALPLLMIGKVKKEKCFRNISCLPVIYQSQTNGLLNSEIFMDWYINEFITAVKKERNNNSRQGKVLLLLHNADFLPNADELNAVDENFQVMIFPENISSLVHSMDQNIMKKLKTMFKVQVLTRLLLTSHNIENIVECSKRISLKDVCYMLADTWSTLVEEKMKEEWKKLWGLVDVSEKNEPPCTEKELKEILEMCKSIPGLSKCDREDIRIWISCEIDDHECQTEEKEEIITPLPNEELVNIEKDNDDSPESDLFTENVPTDVEALEAFEVAIEWCEQQKECFPEQLILLKRLKDLCANKSARKYSELKQK